MNTAVNEADIIATVDVPMWYDRNSAPAVRSKSNPSLDRTRLTCDGSHKVSKITTNRLLNAIKQAGRMYRSIDLLSG